MNNNLISLLDLTFPGINKLFTSPSRESDGHEKWVDFVLAFPHCDMISKLTIKFFSRKYKKWCNSNSYHFTEAACKKIYEYSKHTLETDSLAVNECEETIEFPWFTINQEGDADAYARFMLCHSMLRRFAKLS